LLLARDPIQYGYQAAYVKGTDMTFHPLRFGHPVRSFRRVRSVLAGVRLCPTAASLAFAIATTSAASAATLSRSVDVHATPAAVWSVIGPFCAIKDWHPAIGTCAEKAGSAPTRTLVTKDGTATFEETQTARSDVGHRYSYIFNSSPLPVTNYTSVLQVTAKDRDTSTVTWSSRYTPDRGKELDASNALSGIYETGLGAIKTRFDR
jgi:Polyketide cyclase / dehydrase and lipid transport